MSIETILQNSNGMLNFGEAHETTAIFIFAFALIAATIGIRWILGKYDNRTDSEIGKTEA